MEILNSWKQIQIPTSILKCENQVGEDLPGSQDNINGRTATEYCLSISVSYSANKGPYSQGYGLPSGHIRVWQLDHK